MRRANNRPQNSQELINAIRDEWYNLTFQYCRDLIGSVLRRLHSMVEKNGAMTKY
jgi:hypothetical protein